MFLRFPKAWVAGLLFAVVILPRPGVTAESSDAATLQAIQKRLSEQQAEIEHLRRQVAAQADANLARPRQTGPQSPRLPAAPTNNAQAALDRLPQVDSATDVRPARLEQRLSELEKANAELVSAAEVAEPSDQSRMSELEKKFDALSKKFKTLTDKKPEKKDEFPSHTITGFTQLDTAWYSQTPQNIATVGDAQDGTGFRRARLAVKGKVAEFTNYQIEMDFATAGRPSFFDTYLEQGNMQYAGTVRAGQFCQPFSVDALTGFRNLTFLERSLPFLAFVPFRRVGIQSTHLSEDEDTQWGISVFRTGAFNNAPLGDDRFATDFGDIGGYSTSMRATHLLWYDDIAKDRYLWHVGGSYNFSQLDANDAIGSGLPGNAGSPKPFYQAKTTPEFGTLGYPENAQNFGSAVNGTPIFVDTGRYEASYFNLFGLETLYQNGPLSITSEYMATLVESAVGPIFYQGAYIQAGYRLTGEHRVYDKKNGTLGKIVPFTDFIPLDRAGVCGWGAWEMAFRWSVVDLRNPDNLSGHYYNAATNSFTGATPANNGQGVLNDSTIGLTWFLNVHSKLQFNWIHAMLENDAKGWSTAELFVTRIQVDF